MNLLKRLFGLSSARAAKVSKIHSQLLPSSPGPSDARGQATSPASTRREMLRMALRSTLSRHGIPAAWIGAEMVVSTSRNREPGVHLRLLIRHWDPRLLEHTAAL